MEPNLVFEPGLKVVYFQKMCQSQKPRGLEIGRIGIKLTLEESPNQFKISKLGLDFLLK
jgi:hypothetical protein